MPSPEPSPNVHPSFGPARPVSKASQGGRTGSFGEIGRTGLRHWGGFVYEEWLKELQGRRGAETWREMSDSDPVVGGILYAIEMLCRRVSWWAKPGGSTRRDAEGQEYLEQCLFQDMSLAWPDLLSEILSFLTYGWGWFEIVWKRRGGDVRDARQRSRFDDGRIGIRKLAIRSQDSLDEWEFDEEGGIQAMLQSPPPDYEQHRIPIQKSLLFRTKVTKNNPEGRSILRSAHRPWYFLKNIQNLEGIGIERDLAGLPVLTPPEGIDIWNPNDSAAQAIRAEAEKTVTAIRRDEQEGVLLPFGWELKLLSAEGGGRRQFNSSEVIERYERRIATSVLADIILLGQDKTGSLALSKTKSRLFASSLEAFLDHVAWVVNEHLVPRLFKLNTFSGLTAYPQVEHGNVDDVDLEELGNFIEKLSGAGAPLFPNVELEAHLLDRAGLPSFDPEEEQQRRDEEEAEMEAELARRAKLAEAAPDQDDLPEGGDPAAAPAVDE